jgi:hypothetical protein
MNFIQHLAHDQVDAACYNPNCSNSTPLPTTLDDLSIVSLAIRKALPRLLSSSQKLVFQRAMQEWRERILAGDNQDAVVALGQFAADTTDSLNSVAIEATQRIHSCEEEEKMPERLLRMLETRSEDLQWAIPHDQKPEIVQELSRSHYVARFRGRIVFVEMRQNLGWMAEGADAIESFLRIDSLAARLAKRPKPSAFCTLDLLGYFSDRKDKEYGFVYEWPWDVGSVWDARNRPKTLNEYIAESEADELNIGPSLTRRLEIARAIAICVKTFHIFGWLHKSINSHNILLFPRAPFSQQHSTLQDDQLFVVGFEYSRQHGPNYATEPITKVGDYDLYRHPDVTGFERRSNTASRPNIFKRGHDLYALGILLTEIGIWNRVEMMQSRYYTLSLDNADSTINSVQHVPTPYEFRTWVTQRGKGSIETLLAFGNGDRYTEATMACLREEIKDGDDYFSDLYAKLLEPLNYCTT